MRTTDQIISAFFFSFHGIKMADLITNVTNLLNKITVAKATEILESRGGEVDGILVKDVIEGDTKIMGNLQKTTYNVVLADVDDPTGPSVSTEITITQPTSNSASSLNSNPEPVVATPPVAIGRGGSAAANSELSRQNWAKSVFSYKKGTYPNTQRYDDPFGGSNLYLGLSKRLKDMANSLLSSLRPGGSAAKALEFIAAAKAHTSVDGFTVSIVHGPRLYAEEVYYILDLTHRTAPEVKFRIKIVLENIPSNSSVGENSSRLVKSKLVVIEAPPRGELSDVEMEAYKIMTNYLGHVPKTLEDFTTIKNDFQYNKPGYRSLPMWSHGNNMAKIIRNLAESRLSSMKQQDKNLYRSMLTQGIPGIPRYIVAAHVAPMLGVDGMLNEMDLQNALEKPNSSAAAGGPVTTTSTVAASPAAAGGDPVAADKEKKRRFVTTRKARKQTTRRRRNTRRR